MHCCCCYSKQIIILLLLKRFGIEIFQNWKTHTAFIYVYIKYSTIKSIERERGTHTHSLTHTTPQWVYEVLGRERGGSQRPPPAALLYCCCARERPSHPERITHSTRYIRSMYIYIYKTAVSEPHNGNWCNIHIRRLWLHFFKFSNEYYLLKQFKAESNAAWWWGTGTSKRRMEGGRRPLQYDVTAIDPLLNVVEIDPQVVYREQWRVFFVFFFFLVDRAVVTAARVKEREERRR